MAKKFKLVYDQKGDIKGSYTGIPNADDPIIIERATLDGEKAPAPKPAGEKKIVNNGKHDVAAFASVDVNVPTGITPSGQLEVTENGRYDVANFASAEVNVPTGVNPSGQLEIAENGVYDVTDKASVKVDVKEPEPEPIDNEANMQALKTTLESIALNGWEEDHEEYGEFKFKDCEFEYFAELWDSLDTEAMKRFFNEIIAGKLIIDFDLSMSLRAYAGSTRPEYEPNRLEFLGRGDYRWNRESERYELVRPAYDEPDYDHAAIGARVDTDAETGDSRVVPLMPFLGFGSTEDPNNKAKFSGTITVSYNKQ